MKKKIFSAVATLLLSCCFAIAQNGGIPVELKPFNPPNKPPYGNIIDPDDTLIYERPKSITQQYIFKCFQNSTQKKLIEKQIKGEKNLTLLQFIYIQFM